MKTVNDLFSRNLPVLKLADEGCCLDEPSIQAVRKRHAVRHRICGPADTGFADLVAFRLDGSSGIYWADRVTGTVYCGQSGRSLSGTHAIDDGREEAETIYPRRGSGVGSGRRSFDDSKERLLKSGMARETPACFPSMAEGAAWGALSLRSKSSHTSYCADCTPAFKRQALGRGKCSQPETCFVVEDDALVGVSIRDRRFIKVMGFGPAPLEVVEKPADLRELVAGFLDRGEVKNAEMKRYAMRFVREQSREEG